MNRRLQSLSRLLNSSQKHLLWSVVGAVCAIFFLTVLIYATPSHLLSSILTLLFGLTTSYLLGKRGAIGATGVAWSLLAFYLYEDPLTLWGWDLVLTLNLTSIFAITVLSCEEVAREWDLLCRKVEEQKRAIIHVRERTEMELSQLLSMKGTLDQRLEEQEEKFRQMESQLLSYEQTARFSHEELMSVYAQQEAMIGEISTLRRRNIEVEEECFQLQTLNKQLAKANQTVVEQEQLFFEMQQKDLELKEEYDRLKVVNEQLLQENAQLIQMHETVQFAAQQEKVLSEVPQEPPTPQEGVDIRELRRMEGLYQQLRSQFSEKSTLLDATRKELFLAEERLEALKKELEETKLTEKKNTDLEIRQLLAHAEKELDSAEQKYEVEINQLHDIIDLLVKKHLEKEMNNEALYQSPV